jgi:ketosteroid isomerase-like protein
MNKLVPIAAAAFAAALISGCTPAAEAADPAKVEQTIRAQEAQWQADYQKKDVEGLAGQYAEAAAMGAPGDALATSNVERRKSLQGMVSDPNFALTFSSDRVLVAKSGDLASSRGHYSLTMTDKATSKPATSTGSYLTVYQKQADGSWKAVEDFITPGPAAAPAAA